MNCQPWKAVSKKYNEHVLSVGGQLSKQEGKTLHYNAIAEIGLTGCRRRNPCHRW